MGSTLGMGAGVAAPETAASHRAEAAAVAAHPRAPLPHSSPPSTAAGLPQPEGHRRAQSPPVPRTPTPQPVPPAPRHCRSPRRWHRRHSQKPRARGDFRAAAQAGNKQGCWQQGWYRLGVAERGPLLPPRPLQLLAARPAPQGAHMSPGASSPPAAGGGRGYPWGTPAHRGAMQPSVPGAGPGVPGSRRGGGRMGGEDRGRQAAAPACVGSAMCLGSRNIQLPLLPSARSVISGANYILAFGS